MSQDKTTALSLAVGDKAPPIKAPTDEGKLFDLAAQAGKAVVLFFYPKDDTSGCTKEAIDFTAHLKDFEKAGVLVVGCSRDGVESHAKFRKKHKLGVTLIADQDGSITESYGVWVQKSMYGRTYMGIERATFLINAKGKIQAIWRKVKVPGHAEAVLASVKTL